MERPYIMSTETAVANVEIYILHLQSIIEGWRDKKPSKAEQMRAMYALGKLKQVANYATYGNLSKYQEKENEDIALEEERGKNISKI